MNQLNRGEEKWHKTLYNAAMNGPDEYKIHAAELLKEYHKLYLYPELKEAVDAINASATAPAPAPSGAFRPAGGGGSSSTARGGAAAPAPAPSSASRPVGGGSSSAGAGSVAAPAREEDDEPISLDLPLGPGQGGAASSAALAPEAVPPELEPDGYQDVPSLGRIPFYRKKTLDEYFLRTGCSSPPNSIHKAYVVD